MSGTSSIVESGTKVSYCCICMYMMYIVGEAFAIGRRTHCPSHGEANSVVWSVLAEHRLDVCGPPDCDVGDSSFFFSCSLTFTFVSSLCLSCSHIFTPLPRAIIGCPITHLCCAVPHHPKTTHCARLGKLAVARISSHRDILEASWPRQHVFAAAETRCGHT